MPPGPRRSKKPACGLITATRPNGVETTYGYDVAGRTVGVEHVGPGGPLSSFDYTLDPDGNRTSMTIGAPGGNRTEGNRHGAIACLLWSYISE